MRRLRRDTRPCQCSGSGDTRPLSGPCSISAPFFRRRHSRIDDILSGLAAASAARGGRPACACGSRPTGSGPPRTSLRPPGQAPAPQSTPPVARRRGTWGVRMDAGDHGCAAAVATLAGSGSGRRPRVRCRPCCSACLATSTHTIIAVRAGSGTQPRSRHGGTPPSAAPGERDGGPIGQAREHEFARCFLPPPHRATAPTLGGSGGSRCSPRRHRRDQAQVARHQRKPSRAMP